MAEHDDERTFGSFEEFWSFYLGEHRDPMSRAFHYVGTGLGTLTLFAAVYLRNPWLVPVAVVLGYAPAWIAHLFIEGNRPATLKHPVWSLMADFKMLGLAIRGKMDDEVSRLQQDHPEEE